MSVTWTVRDTLLRRVYHCFKILLAPQSLDVGPYSSWMGLFTFCMCLLLPARFAVVVRKQGERIARRCAFQLCSKERKHNTVFVSAHPPPPPPRTHARTRSHSVRGQDIALSNVFRRFACHPRCVLKHVRVVC